jgi:succinoglycan biosynthesis transport protein ExoP
VLSILRRRKWSGLVAFIATLSLGLPFVLVLPNVYRGVATVSIEDLDSSALIRVNVPELETRLVTIQQELLSRSRLTDLVTRLRLYPRWRAHGSMEGIVTTMRRDIHIELSRTERSGRPTAIGLKISYIGLDAKSAAAVPNALAAMYVSENTKIRERQTSEMAAFLKTQLETERSAVDEQQGRLDRFKRERAGRLPEQVSLNMVTLERLNTRLRMNTDDQLRIRELQDRLSGDTPASESAPDPLQAAKQRLADLQLKFTDKHPDVIRAKAEVAGLEQQPAHGGAPPRKSPRIGNADATLASLKSEERMLRSEIAEYEQHIQDAPRVEQELEALQRDYNSAKETYASILKRYEEAQLADSLEQTKKTESFRILDSAIVPTSPAAPNRLRLLLMALFVAVAASIGMMLLTEHLDTSFHSVGEVRQFTTVPILASIPHVSSRTSLTTILRVALVAVGVVVLCVALAGFAYREARENTQLVWMLSAPQI